MDMRAVRTQHLDCALRRLGSGVAEESSLQAAGFGKPFGKRTLKLVVVQVGCVNQFCGLVANYPDHARMIVTKRIYANSGDEVQILLSIRIPQVRTLSA